MNRIEASSAALGFFDGMHLGHRSVIEHALTAGKRLGVPVSAFTFTGQPSLPKFGGQRDVCLLSYFEKDIMLHECGVRRVFAYDFDEVRELSPEAFFENIVIGAMNAVFVVCGNNFRFGKNGAGDTELLGRLCKEHDIGFETIPAVMSGDEPISSTRIRSLIREGNIEEASAMLGYDFGYRLPVIHGRQLGHKLGFPTINQIIPDYMIHPRHGVYASSAMIGEDVFPAITDIGVKPTVGSDCGEIMETHIIGFDGDVYDRAVKVSLRFYMRGEKKFSGLDELRAQLEKDKDISIHTFS